MISLTYLFARTAALEHLEHPVRDKEPTDYVAGGGDDGNRAQDRREGTLFFTDKNDRAYDAMASSALVSDISGVCSKGET